MAIGTFNVAAPAPTVASYVNPPLPLFGYCVTEGVFVQFPATPQLPVEPFQTDETSAPFADAVSATAISNDTVRLFPLPRYPGGGSGWGFVPPLAKDPHPALPRITGGGREGKRQNATAARL